jgi:hypothetical protein
MPSSKPLGASLALLAMLSADLVGCASATPSPAAGSQTSVQPSSAPSVETALRGDPQFTDFVHMIDFAGLGHELHDAQDVTIFAPTNMAFDTTDPGWRQFAVVSDQDNLGAGGQRFLTRQTLMADAGIRGVHPPSEFVGKISDITSISGLVFHVDGMTPGTLQISTLSATPGAGFGKPLRGTANLQLPPEKTADGLIYAASGIVVPLTGAK